MCTLLFCLFPSNAWTTLVTFGLYMWVAQYSLWPAAAPEEVPTSRERPRTLHNTQYYYHCYHCGRQSDYSLFTTVWISVDWGIIWRSMLQCRTSMAGTVTDSHSPAVTWLPFQNNASVIIHTTYYSGKIRLTRLPFQNSASVIIHNIIVTKSAGWVSHDYYFKIVSR